jgi:hypothetical protein
MKCLVYLPVCLFQSLAIQQWTILDFKYLLRCEEKLYAGKIHKGTGEEKENNFSTQKKKKLPRDFQKKKSLSSHSLISVIALWAAVTYIEWQQQRSWH